MGIQSQINISLKPEYDNVIRDFVLEDFNETFVFDDDFLLAFNFVDDLILLMDYKDYVDLATRVYKYMRIYL